MKKCVPLRSVGPPQTRKFTVHDNPVPDFIINLKVISGYTSVRHLLYFDHFHIFDLFCSSTTLFRPMYFFCKSGLIIGREVQADVQFWST